MADAVEVKGLDDLARLTRALKAAGEEGKGLRKELYSGLNRATKGIRADLKAEVGESLPRGGGLAARVQKSARFANSTRTSGNTIGVRLVARGKGRRTLQTAESQGQIRHKVFGRAGSWVTQTQGVRAGLLARQFDKDKPEVRHEVLVAISTANNKVARSLG